MKMFAFAAGLLIGSLAGVFVTCACKAAGWADREDDRRDRDGDIKLHDNS